MKQGLETKTHVSFGGKARLFFISLLGIGGFSRHIRVSLGLMFFCVFFLFFGIEAGEAGPPIGVNNFIADGGEWNTASNWSLGHVPTYSEDTTFTGIVTPGVSLTTTTTAVEVKSINFSTAGATFIFSGSVNITPWGSLILKSGMTWSHTGQLYFRTLAANLDTNGVSLATVQDFRVYSGGVLTLINNDLYIGGSIYIYGGSSFITNNLTVRCTIFGDNGNTGNVTLTLGSSTINATNVSFAAATLTVTANTAAINITSTVDITANFGNYKTWSGTITILMSSGKAFTLNGVATFGNFAISWTGINSIWSQLVLWSSPLTVTGTFTVAGGTAVNHPMVRGSYGSHVHISAGTVNITGAVDFRDITGEGAGSWDLSAIVSGNLGGNSGITFRTPANYYLCGMTTQQWLTSNIFSIADDGVADGANVYPLPQDTLVINNNSGNNTNQILNGYTGFRWPAIDASALTEVITLSLTGDIYSVFYGDLLFGPGLTVITTGSTLTLDARLKNEASDTQDINAVSSIGSGAISIVSYGGTVRLLTNDLTHTGTFTLTRGTFDLNGKALSTNTFSSSNSNIRALQDSAGGGKIIAKGLTGTIFDLTTTTNLTVSNAPAIDVGTSNLTLSGDVTVILGYFTWGNFKVTKHAGNYAVKLMNSGATLGTIILETPDASYQYIKAQFQASTTFTCSGFVANGTATYPISLGSTSSSNFTINDSSGTNTLYYTTISYSTAGGGATWNSYYTNGGNNTGWNFYNNFIADGGEWNTASNWSLGHVPTNSEDTTFTGIISAGKTITITTTTAVAKSVDFSTAGAVFTLTMAGDINIYGSLTCKNGMTWTANFLNINLLSNGNLDTNGATIGGFLNVRASVAIINNNVVVVRDFSVWAGASLTTNNYTITCGAFKDSGAGAVTLTLGSSTINATNVSFSAATLTVSDNTATVNITSTVDTTSHLGGVAWGTGGDTNFVYLMTGGKVLTLNGANTVGNLAISWTTANVVSRLNYGANQTISGTLNITGGSGIVGPMINTNAGQRTITAAAINITGTVYIRGIVAAGASAPWNLSAIPSGNMGWNSNITFRTPATYYATTLTANRNFSDNIWSTTDDGTADGVSIFPVTQDTIIINNNTGDNTNKTLAIDSNNIGNIDASTLTEALILGLGWRNYFGNLILTGSGLTTTLGGTSVMSFDSQVKSELSETLNIDIPSTLAGNFYISSWVPGATAVKLLNNLSISGMSTLNVGTFDLNGKTLSSYSFNSSNTNTRTLQDSAGGGKILITGTTGGIFDCSTITNLTILNAPDVTLGTSALTLAGNITIAPGTAKIWGDLTIAKHKGDYYYHIGSTCEFGAITIETPDTDYPYNNVRFQSDRTKTCSSFVANGTPDYPISIYSDVPDTPFTLSDSSGTNILTYANISDSTVQGGVLWGGGIGSVNGGGNTGWVWGAAPVLSFDEDVAVGLVESDTITANWGAATVKKWEYDSDGTCSDVTGDYSQTNLDSIDQDTETNNGKFICLYGEDLVGFKSTLASANDINIDDTFAIRSDGAPSDTLDSDVTATTLSLVTSEEATCKYGTVAGTNYDNLPSTFSTTGSTVHSVSLYDLESDADYTYYIRCNDSFGNENDSDYLISFSIAKKLAEIDSVKYSSTQNSITIKWETDNPSDSVVEYGLTRSLGEKKKDSDNEEDHKIILKNLIPNTKYYFKIRSVSQDDDSDSSKIYSISTQPEVNPLINYDLSTNNQPTKEKNYEEVQIEVSDIPDEKQEIIKEEPKKEASADPVINISKPAEKEGIFSKLFNASKGAVISIGERITGFYSGLYQGAKTIAGNVGDGIKTQTRNIASLLISGQNKLKNIASSFNLKKANNLKTRLFTTEVFRKNNTRYLSEVKFQLLDKKNNPIPELETTLFSDPQMAITDVDGIATFKDVPIGEHALAFNYQGENFKKNIAIADTLTDEGKVRSEITVIKAQKEKIIWWIWMVIAMLLAAIGYLVFKNYNLKKSLLKK